MARKPFDLAAAWKLYKSGYTLARLGKKLHRSPSGLHRYFTTAGKKLRPAGFQAKRATRKARR